MSRASFVLESIADRLGGFPREYVTYDMETTGLSFKYPNNEDLILDSSFVDVRRAKIVSKEEYVFNWLDKKAAIDESWLCERLAIRNSRMQLPFTVGDILKRMKSVGQSPETCLIESVDYIQRFSDKRIPIVGCNIINFDIPVLISSCKEWFGVEPDFDFRYIFDLHVICKACKLGVAWKSGDFEEYQSQFVNKRLKGCSFDSMLRALNIEYCVPEKDRHTSKGDAIGCAYIMESWRKKYGL